MRPGASAVAERDQVVVDVLEVTVLGEASTDADAAIDDRKLHQFLRGIERQGHDTVADIGVTEDVLGKVPQYRLH